MLSALKDSKDGVRSMGLTYIRFATEQPRLFQALFMSGAFKIKRIIDIVEREEETDMVKMLASLTGLKEQGAKEFFAEIWLMVRGKSFRKFVFCCISFMILVRSFVVKVI